MWRSSLERSGLPKLEGQGMILLMCPSPSAVPSRALGAGACASCP